MNILSLFGHAGHDHSLAYNYGSSSSTLSGEEVAGVMAAVMIFMLIAAAIVYIITSLSLASIFKKAGVESWKAWVPVYNAWVMLELGGQKGYWAILLLIPVVNIVASIFVLIAMYHVGLKLGKPGEFVLLAIFLPLVWYVWLAVDKSTWHGAKPKKV